MTNFAALQYPHMREEEDTYSTQTTSENDQSQESPPISHVPSYSVIGVSIGKAQTRLASPSTPAAEKIQAINDGGGYFSLSESLDDVPEHAASPHIPLERPITIRKSSSTGSFSVLGRALSTASSYGDDSRFINVRGQINSRFKAVRDSLQDSNFRLPSLPSLPSMPSLPSLPSVTLPNLPKLPSLLNSKPKTEGPSHLRRNTYHSGNSRLKYSDSDHSAGMKPSIAATHPYFLKALTEITGDVVIFGGYRGSHLKTVEKPHGRRVWLPPFSAALNFTKVNLEVGLDDEDEERMSETIIPDGMLSHVGPIDVSRRLIKRLRMCTNAQQGKLRVHEWSYDWRLSPHRLSNQLIQLLESLECNKPSAALAQRGAIIIAHSLGGLITRYAVNQKPDLFSGVVFAGTPQHCVNILGPFRNGDDVLLSSKILTPQVNFTIRTSYLLLPLDGKCFIDIDTAEELHVDFFNPDDWIKYKFSPVIEPILPAISPAKSSSMIGSVLDNLPFLGRRGSLTKKSAEAAGEKGAEFAGAVPTMNNSSHAIRDGHANNSTNTTNTSAATSRNQSSSPSLASFSTAASSLSNSLIFPTLPNSSSSASTPCVTSAHHQATSPASSTTTTTTTTTTTISREKALTYLSRTLAATASFKRSLAHNPRLAINANNAYPPLSVIYGKTEPTVCGAYVRNGHSGIARVDAYDNLIFASGDGVVLARAAALPDGYRAAKGGVVGSERGHIGLLGDLEAVGRCLLALMRERRKGVGLGPGKLTRD